MQSRARGPTLAQYDPQGQRIHVRPVKVATFLDVERLVQVVYFELLNIASHGCFRLLAWSLLAWPGGGPVAADCFSMASDNLPIRYCETISRWQKSTSPTKSRLSV